MEQKQLSKDGRPSAAVRGFREACKTPLSRNKSGGTTDEAPGYNNDCFEAEDPVAFRGSFINLIIKFIKNNVSRKISEPFSKG